jgi:microcystin-dependent protein
MSKLTVGLTGGLGPGASMARQAYETSHAASPHDRIEPEAVIDYRIRLKIRGNLQPPL